MSTIQQLKNLSARYVPAHYSAKLGPFLSDAYNGCLGKQARAAAPEEPPRKTEQQQAPTVQHKTASDPSNTHYARAQDPGNEYGDDDYARSKSKKRVDDEKLAKLIAEENASKSKIPSLPWPRALGTRRQDGEELSRHVIVQVAKALEYLHEEKGVVHRDIKPENILFEPIPMVPSKHPKPKQPGDEDKVDEGDFIPGQGAGGIGRIKIADFGLSKIVWDNQTMTPCGTVGYTAPEIVKDERYSKSVDMWALGCVLYTLLCGFPPFYDESIEVLTEKVAKGQYTFLSPWWTRSQSLPRILSAIS
ncbi:hypothetical protein Lal_00045039 [Lupinus albus]|nr:hypothetical protein Lal_00045039 [Lupinus albus]